MDLYMTHNGGRSYSVRLRKSDGWDGEIGVVSYDRILEVWSAVFTDDEGEKDIAVFGSPSSAIRWVVEKEGLETSDRAIIDLLDTIIGIEDDESSEIRVEQVVVPVYPIDIVEVAGKKDLWSIRLRWHSFDHHGNGSGGTTQLGLFGHDDDGWFTLCAGMDKVHGDAVDVIQKLFTDHGDLSFALARMVWKMFNELDNRGFVQLSRRGYPKVASGG